MLHKKVIARVDLADHEVREYLHQGRRTIQLGGLFGILNAPALPSKTEFRQCLSWRHEEQLVGFLCGRGQRREARREGRRRRWAANERVFDHDGQDQPQQVLVLVLERRLRLLRRADLQQPVGRLADVALERSGQPFDHAVDPAGSAHVVTVSDAA